MITSGDLWGEVVQRSLPKCLVREFQLFRAKNVPPINTATGISQRYLFSSGEFSRFTITSPAKKDDQCAYVSDD